MVISSVLDDARAMSGEAPSLWKRKKLAKYIGHCGVLPRGEDPRLRCVVVRETLLNNYDKYEYEGRLQRWMESPENKTKRW